MIKEKMTNNAAHAMWLELMQGLAILAHWIIHYTPGAWTLGISGFETGLKNRQTSKIQPYELTYDEIEKYRTNSIFNLFKRQIPIFGTIFHKNLFWKKSSKNLKRRLNK